MTKKDILKFPLGTVFLIDLKLEHLAQMKVVFRKGDQIQFEISRAEKPSFCDRCGQDDQLFVNETTGVVTCKSPGCGKKFGYTLVKTTKVLSLSSFRTKVRVK